MFLLEVGAGFSFIALQKRIQLDGKTFYIDLLFYSRKVKQLVAVEPRQGSFRAEWPLLRSLPGLIEQTQQQVLCAFADSYKVIFQQPQAVSLIFP